MASFPEHTDASESLSLQLQAAGLSSMIEPVRSEPTNANRIGAAHQDDIRLADSSNAWHWGGESSPGLPDGFIPGGYITEFPDRDSADLLSLSWRSQVQRPVGQSSVNPLHPPNRTPSQYSYSLMSWNDLDTTSRRPSQNSAPPMNNGASAADLLLRCNGSGSFRVHRLILASASSNHFNQLLRLVSTSMDSTLTIDEDYDVTYVMLDAIYSALPKYTFTSEGGRKHDTTTMDLPLLIRAIERMIVYGVQPGDFIRSSSLLFKCLYQHTPLQPLEIFTLAAHYRIEALAVQISSHLLSLNFDTVTDECRREIGPEYYNRLLSLHTDRLDALKLIVTDPPLGHPYTLLCTNSDQDDMVNLWNSGMSMVQKDATPYLSPQFLVAQMRPYQAKVNCVTCSQHFTARLTDVAVEWSKVKCTI